MIKNLKSKIQEQRSTSLSNHRDGFFLTDAFVTNIGKNLRYCCLSGLKTYNLKQHAIRLLLFRANKHILTLTVRTRFPVHTRLQIQRI